MTTPSSSASRPPRPGTGPLRLLIGALSLFIATAASGALVAEHFGSIGLPGCGSQGGCGAAAKSIYGTIPPFGLPTSMLGLAYFAAVLAGYLATKGRPGAIPRWIARLGALASLGFLIVSITDKLLCPYCIASHVANFLFLIILETTPRTPPLPRKGAGLVASLTTFLVLIGALGIAEAGSKNRAREKAEQELRDSTREAIARSQPNTPDTPPDTNPDAPPANPDTPTSDAPTSDTNAAAQNTTEPTSTEPNPGTTPATETTPTEPAPAKPFTGRYRLGPEVSPVRIVIFSDYQCPECKSMEKQALEVLAKHPEVSLSAKHFPFCTECNRHMGGFNKHPLACRAARAAEAAGIVGGNNAFWLMHQWIFSVSANFTDAALSAKVLELGLDPAAFTAAMNDPATNQLAASDVEEGMSLGVMYTPTVFVNGVELRGVISQGALMRAVEAILASNPTPATAAADRPPSLDRKVVEDWLAERPVNDPVDDRAWSVGPDDAPLKLAMWGDYAEPFTARADAAVRAIVASRTDLKYTFRHFPANPRCNPYVQQMQPMSQFSCFASRAAEAAGELGGDAGYWQMHDWLLANQKAFSEQAIVAAAVALGAEHGYDEAKFREAYRGKAAQAALDQDVRGSQRIGIRSIPTMTLNGRKIPRWLVGETVVLDKIIDEAAKQLAPRAPD